MGQDTSLIASSNFTIKAATLELVGAWGREENTHLFWPVTGDRRLSSEADWPALWVLDSLLTDCDLREAVKTPLLRDEVFPLSSFRE